MLLHLCEYCLFYIYIYLMSYIFHMKIGIKKYWIIFFWYRKCWKQNKFYFPYQCIIIIITMLIIIKLHIVLYCCFFNLTCCLIFCQYCFYYWFNLNVTLLSKISCFLFYESMMIDSVLGRTRVGIFNALKFVRQGGSSMKNHCYFWKYSCFSLILFFPD